MSITRRVFVRRAAAGIAGVLAASPKVLLAGPPVKAPIKAIAFDAFPIFDPRPVFALADELFPGKGAELSNEWRTRQFEYTWLRVALRRYADFWQVTQDALVFAANRLKVELSPQQRDRLMNAYCELKTWPDVVPALSALKKSGIRLAFLSNFTAKMLDGCIRSAGLDGTFEHVLSTDQAKTHKPDPRAYQLGPDILKLRREEILFVAFAGWDAAGAKAFGYPTYWVNRLNLPPEELGEVPDGRGSDLSALVDFLAR
jgi:2-haloacid dehalogenase